MIRVTKYLAARLVPLLMTLVILLAVAASAGRLLAPVVSQFRGDVELWAEEALGQPVQIGLMEARWRGFGPQLLLRDLALLDVDTHRPALRLADVRVDIGLLDLLHAGPPMPRQITIVGASVLVKRRSDGSIAVAGLEGATPGGNESGLFLLPRRLVLSNSELYWQNLAIGAEPQRFSDVDIQLINDGDHHQIDARLSLPGGSGEQLELAADLRGKPDQPGAWVGDFYLKGEGLTLAKLLKDRLPPGYDFERGQVDMELWTHWDGGQLTWMQGLGAWRDLRLAASGSSGETPEQALEAESGGGRFHWQHLASGWRLDVDELHYQHAGRSWPPSGFSVQVEHNAQNRLQVSAGLDFLRLEDLTAILDVFPLPPGEAAEALAALQPRADLSALQIRYRETDAAPHWSLQGTIDALHTAPWRGAPAVNNLSGAISADQNGGTLHLKGAQVALDFPTLFRAPLQLDRIEGQAHWRLLPGGGWRIHTEELIAANADLQTRTRLRLDLPAERGESPFLDLQTDFHDGEVTSTHRYLPVGIMPKGVVSWLDRSLQSGRVSAGSCLVRGRLRDFPYAKDQVGRFEVLFQVEDLVLDYWPGWPRLEGLSAEVRFLDNRFDAWIARARLLDSEIQDTHGYIDELAQGSPFTLDGVVHGPLTDELRLLRESPLAEKFAPLVADMRAEGDARLALGLAIPLKNGAPPFRLDGRLRLEDATLHLDDWQLALSRIQGDLLFDQDQIRGKDLRARALGAPIRIDIGAVPGQADSTRIQAQGGLAGAALDRAFPGRGLSLLQGTGNWTLQLDFPPLGTRTKNPVLVTAQSDLAGMAIDLPAPLGKTAAETRRLYLATQFDRQKQRPLRARYGDILAAELLLDTSDPQAFKLVRGDLNLGGEPAALPEQEGLRLRAKLQELDLAPWLEQWKTAETGAAPLINRVNVEVGALRSGETELGDLALQLEHGAEGWSGNLASKRFEGALRIPADLEQNPISVRLQRLELDFSPGSEEADEGPAPDTATTIDPRRLPALDLRSEKLILNARDLGPLVLQARKTPQGLQLDPLALSSESLTLDATGYWQVIGERQESRLTFALETESLGRLLSHLGFTPNMKGAPATIKGQLDWPSDPTQAQLATLKGHVDMQLGEGRFLQVEPGVGRIFGLLNIGALERRLTLDFSDLFKKGFSFDRIEGTFTMDEGDAYTNNLSVAAPAAQIDIAGRTGLISQDYDQTVTVTPHVTSSLPLAGAIAGGPAVGAALFLAQKVMGRQVDKITRERYQITGPWDEPVITKETAEAPIPATVSPPADQR